MVGSFNSLASGLGSLEMMGGRVPAWLGSTGAKAVVALLRMLSSVDQYEKPIPNCHFLRVSSA